MDIQAILKELEFNRGYFPHKAVEEAIANRDEIIPELLKIIEQAEQNAVKLLEQPYYIAHIYAMYLLAQFREKRAYPLIVKFFSLPGEISQDLTGDVVTENLGQILASVSCGDISLITSLIENDNVNEWVRGAGLAGLLTLVASGERSRDEVISYFKTLFREKLKREYCWVWTELAVSSTDLYPEELYDDIKKAYEEGLVDSSAMEFEEVDSELLFGKERAIERLRTKRYKLIENTVSSMEWWYCFHREESPPKPKPQSKGVHKKAGKKKKIGRNEPCPCGSGKKYKKCCGKN